ncbi:MAG TPA: hypothetical protein ENK19_00760 [Acidobacteria bacterium]|nr:hypothetical protein [Acidobacteriota bacterium]
MSDRKYRHRGYMDDSDDRERPRRRGPESKPGLEGAPRGRGVGMPTAVVFRCAVCGRNIKLLGDIEPTAVCPQCGKPLHTCTNCAFFDPGAPFECRKPLEARVDSKARANRCPFFAPKTVRDLSSRGPQSPDDARAAFDALFKK